jgi:hypothetical protein
MTQHIKPTLMTFSPKNPHTKPTPFSPAIIERIMKLVGDRTMQCQIDIVTAAQMIAEMPDYVSPTVERRQLLNVVAKLHAAQAAIDALPRYAGLIALNALPPSYGLRDDVAIIAEIIKRAATMASKITVRRSTGSPKKHFVARQKMIAAVEAAYLLKGRRLTTSSDGIFNRTAVALFELGTGRAPAERSLEKACAKVLSQGRSD